MLECLDGVVLAVGDSATAEATYESLFGTSVAHKSRSETLNAEITALRCGTDVIRIASPTGPGPVADHLEQWGEGLFAAVFATADTEALTDRLGSKGIGVEAENDLVHLDPAVTFGLRTMITPFVDRQPFGVISFLYEVTHLVHDWQKVSDFWVDTFGLDGAKFSPIQSDTYGYEGMLTLFDPPRRLDRIEVVTPNDESKAMGRFFAKRGEGPYMFFTECEDTMALRDRLRATGARFAPDDGDPRQSLFLHPSSTHGVLIGVSPTNQAWTWSGRPELAGT
jgi:catechol 2,3-dioxygenase-like lactoylglutathione lyase family enzyme